MKYALRTPATDLSPSSRLRRGLVAGLIALLTVSVTACGGKRFSFSRGGSGVASSTAPADGLLAPGADGNATRVALLLPLSAGGKFSKVAKSLKSAAELALFESGRTNILLIPKDTGGTAAGARRAAANAVKDGAEIILGPLFAGSVGAAGAVARASNVPVIGFSTTTSVAGNGIYLLSLTPQEEVERIVDYTMRQGKTRLGALIPMGPYGNVVAAAFRRAIERRGGKLVAVERYSQNAAALNGPVARISGFASGPNPSIDAILIAEADPLLRAIAPKLVRDNNVDTRKVKLIGTGLWSKEAITSENALSGGWFPSPPPSRRRDFENRYQQVYGTRPVGIASLAYDAVNMAIKLSGHERGDRFTRARLEDPSGFSGVNGAYRFRANGTPERGLSILEVTPSGFRVIDSGRRGFGSGLGF